MQKINLTGNGTLVLETPDGQFTFNFTEEQLAVKLMNFIIEHCEDDVVHLGYTMKSDATDG